MDNRRKDRYSSMIVAPYIQKATALIGVPRKTGGNQFRHAIATFGILIDYGYEDDVLLKTSLIHDLIEEIDGTSPDEIIGLDEHGWQVWKLLVEVSKSPYESKEQYLENILKHGSRNAKILKVADRISNLTDLHIDVFPPDKMSRYLDETVRFIYPMAQEVNGNMAIEIMDLVQRRREILKFWYILKIIKIFPGLRKRIFRISYCSFTY